MKGAVCFSLRLHKLQIDTLFEHVIHISGQQMCAHAAMGAKLVC